MKTNVPQILQSIRAREMLQHFFHLNKKKTTLIYILLKLLYPFWKNEGKEGDMHIESRNLKGLSGGIFW